MRARSTTSVLLYVASMAAPTLAAADEWLGWNALTTRDGWVDGKNPDENPHRGVKRTVEKIRYVIIHSTGSGVVADAYTKSAPVATLARKIFRTQEVQPHYLIDYEGRIYQFVPDAYKASHTGMKPDLWTRYQNGGSGNGCAASAKDWRCLSARGEQYLSAKLPGYALWDRRWGCGRAPDLPAPNSASIGIELLAHSDGEPPRDYVKKLGPVPVRRFTDKQYDSLARLVGDLTRKYRIPLRRSRLVLHEDANPVMRITKRGDRFYDPGPHFDMARLLADLGAQDDSPGPGNGCERPAPPPSPPIVQTPSYQEVGTAIVTADTLNVREKASSSSRRLATVAKSTELPVLRSKDGWHTVLYRGLAAFVSAKYAALERDPAGSIALRVFAPRAGRFLVTRYVRRFPTKQGKVLATVQPGVELEADASTEALVEGIRWYHVRVKNGASGWVAGKGIELQPAVALGAASGR